MRNSRQGHFIPMQRAHSTRIGEEFGCASECGPKTITTLNQKKNQTSMNSQRHKTQKPNCLQNYYIDLLEKTFHLGHKSPLNMNIIGKKKYQFSHLPQHQDLYHSKLHSHQKKKLTKGKRFVISSIKLQLYPILSTSLLISTIKPNQVPQTMAFSTQIFIFGTYNVRFSA